MSTCATDSPRAAARLLVVGLLATLALPGAARAGDVEATGEITLGARLFDYESPFHGDDLTSYFDRTHPVSTRNAEIPYHLDLVHVDLGLVRPDGTWLLRGERWSELWLNDRALVELDFRGLDLEVDYHRFRTDELRVFPRGTRQTLPVPTPVFPTFASFFNPDGSPFLPDGSRFVPDPPPPLALATVTEPPPITAPADPLGRDRRFFRRRTGVDGMLRFRPEGAGLEIPGLDELRVLAGFERRVGARQERFLLDALQEPALRQTSRWRGWRRKLEHEITRVGGGFTASPLDLFTADFEGSYERFRVRERQLTHADLVASDTTLSPAIAPAQAARSYNFLPETRRLTGRLLLSRHFGEGVVHGGAFATRLSQAGNRSPLQRFFDLGDSRVTTWSVHGAFDLPLPLGFGVSGAWKYTKRRSDIDEDAFDRVSTKGTQVGIYLRQRAESRGDFELSWRPLPGTLLAAGYREHRIDRNLRFNPLALEPVTQAFLAALPTVVLPIGPQVAFLRDRTTLRRVFARARARVFQRLQLSARVAYDSVPEVALPRDLTSVFHAEGRASLGLHPVAPANLQAWARFRSGENDEIDLVGRRLQPPPPFGPPVDPEAGLRQEKRFDRVEWSWGGVLTTALSEDLVLTGTFTEHFDRQKWSFVRSQVPRYQPVANLLFFLDSVPTYESRVRTAIATLRTEPLEGVELALSGAVTWTRIDFPGEGPDGPTSAILEEVNGIRTRITTLEARLGLPLRRGLRLELGYRFDDYYDARRHLDPLSLESHVNTFELGLRVDLDGLLP